MKQAGIKSKKHFFPSFTHACFLSPTHTAAMDQEPPVSPNSLLTQCSCSYPKDANSVSLSLYKAKSPCCSPCFSGFSVPAHHGPPALHRSYSKISEVLLAHGVLCLSPLGGSPPQSFPFPPLPFLFSPATRYSTDCFTLSIFYGLRILCVLLPFPRAHFSPAHLTRIPWFSL